MFGSFKPYTYKKREIDDDYFSFVLAKTVIPLLHLKLHTLP